MCIYYRGICVFLQLLDKIVISLSMTKREEMSKAFYGGLLCHLRTVPVSDTGYITKVHHTEACHLFVL